MAIKDELGPYHQLNQVKFNEFKDVIENSLKKRLEKLKMTGIDAIILFMSQELIANQSLITIANV